MSDQHLREAGRAIAGGAPATGLLGMLDHQQRIALVKAALSFPREDIVLDENTLGFQLLRHVATALRNQFAERKTTSVSGGKEVYVYEVETPFGPHSDHVVFVLGLLASLTNGATEHGWKSPTR